jgi:septal ring factor EnvC (AmiA/AmiB activator)
MVHKRLGDPGDPLAGFRAGNGRFLVDLDVVERLAAARAVLAHPAASEPPAVRGADSAEHPLEFNLRFAESRARSAENELERERRARLEERVAHLEAVLATREHELARAYEQLAALATQITHTASTIAALTKSTRPDR